MDNITNINRSLDFTQLLSGYIEDELKSINQDSSTEYDFDPRMEP